MKKMILGLVAVVASVTISHAQQTGKVEMTGDVCYQHFFLNDDAGVISYSGGGLIQLGADYYLTDTFYVGGSLGSSIGVVSSEYSGIDSWTNMFDLRVPLHAGISSKDGSFKLDTGPFIDFSIAGKTETTYGSMSEKSVTRLKDMDVNRVSLGWGVSVKVFNYLKIGYGIKLTDSVYGQGGDVHMITIGVDLSVL